MKQATKPTVNYEKYETMDRKSIFNQLLKEERKLSKLEQDLVVKIKAQKELVKYLRAKTIDKLEVRKTYNTKNKKAAKNS